MAIDWKQLRQRTDKALSELITKSKIAARNLNDSEFAAKARETSFEAGIFARYKVAEGQRWVDEQVRKRTEPTSPKTGISELLTLVTQQRMRS